jgi:hypothetical protein
MKFKMLDIIIELYDVHVVKCSLWFICLNIIVWEISPLLLEMLPFVWVTAGTDGL